jgi:hypothetical protein
MQITYTEAQFTYTLIDGDVVVNRGTDKQHERDGYYLLQHCPETYIAEWDETFPAEEVEAGWIITEETGFRACFIYTDMETWEGVQLVEMFATLDEAALFLVRCAETRERYYGQEVETKVITG